MISTGIYHPFSFVTRKGLIDTQTVYTTELLDVIITGDFSDVSLCKLSDDSVFASGVESNYQVNGIDVKSFRITSDISGETESFYINIDDKYFADCVIEPISSSLRYDCIFYLFTKNSCSNQFHDWDNDNEDLKLAVIRASEITPVFESEQRILITDKGKKEKAVRLSKRNRIEFVAPSMMINMLNGMKLNDENYILSQYENQEIINIEIEAQEQGDGRYTKFIFTFEYADTLTDGNTCCDGLSIDTIISPETPVGECGDFAVEISETDDELSVTLIEAPTGTPSYKWYRNNVFLSSASTINVVGAGNYRVDVTIIGCRASASWFKDNVCALFQIETVKTANEINATASNVPDGETVSWSVVLNGSEVSTSLPYTATESGIYYVYGTAGECQRVKGVYVELVDDDCGFTLSIDEDGSTLTAVTDAGTPTYLWELETGEGRTTLGTGETITATGKGIYWLTVTNGECSDSVYLYKEPGTEQVVWVGTKISGTEVSVVEIDLDSITNPAFDLYVEVNGVGQTYVSPAPLTTGQYGISSGKIVFAVTLSNATIKVIKK